MGTPGFSRQIATKDFRIEGALRFEWDFFYSILGTLEFFAAIHHYPIMTADELKQLLQGSPFRPFTVYLPSEKSFSIQHPEFAVLTPKGRTLIILHTDDDAFDLVDVPLIARVEVQQKSAI